MIENTELDDADAGTWKVTTQSATYVLDLEARTGLRLADTGNAATLRRDGEPFTLLRVVTCTIGWPMVLLIDLAVDGVPMTRRISTEVVSITPLSNVGLTDEHDDPA